MNGIFKSLPFRLLIGVAAGIVLGLWASGFAYGGQVMQVVLTLKELLSSLINFCVPLIIIGFIAPSITRLKQNASRMLALALVLAYTSSVCAALMSMAEFQRIVLDVVTRVIIPILPFFIAGTFTSLAYEGSITRQLPVFLIVILIVMVGHYIWLAVLYGLAGAYSGANPWEVLRHYGPAYLTAVGTMSSAATLAVALRGARKSSVLRRDMVDFGIPLFANIHLCGSVLTEVFFVMTVSKVLYGQLPAPMTMVLFCILLGIFAVGAPGVPGGTVMASLGLIISVLGFDDTGTGLMMTIFALQDSFGTACNVTGDGALTLMLTGYAKKHNIQEVQSGEIL